MDPDSLAPLGFRDDKGAETSFEEGQGQGLVHARSDSHRPSLPEPLSRKRAAGVSADLVSAVLGYNSRCRLGAIRSATLNPHLTR
jgi:hypothetical protein